MRKKRGMEERGRLRVEGNRKEEGKRRDLLEMSSGKGGCVGGKGGFVERGRRREDEQEE